MGADFVSGYRAVASVHVHGLKKKKKKKSHCFRAIAAIVQCHRCVTSEYRKIALFSLSLSLSLPLIHPPSPAIAAIAFFLLEPK